MATSRSRSSISPFRFRRAPPAPVGSKAGTRPATPCSSSSSRPSTPSSLPAISGVVRQAPPPPLCSAGTAERPEAVKAKENVTVTVRFRPLSAREINKGDEVAWYADGDHTVRSEHNASIAYGFDRVFGPATTTRHVYDVAAQNVVNGAMEGVNGTVFAYGVTSSGKTHTMHGGQKSPGIIPLAIKDVFSIIQETPGREFLLRVSYLEIYNEVINDLLDPTGQNLKIREDSQGTFVEGVKEEVVLSPAHALSLIASGEEHRHVGSNNFNLLSSRSHTIFTLTIESSPSGDNCGEEDVALSQLNLIDLAGSESSKTETTGLRRKEGSYINKSLLALGTVISKLTDGKASHIPYRDSKLTRILQSSLSGHGRISLICTVTPASSASEETHNTLKFAHRSKHVEIKASQNKIIDERSLIKKYQKEISCLKQELQQLKRGMMEKPYLLSSDQEDLVNLKLQLQAGQVKLQSRLEEEEQAKAALMGRIHRLTKLILVSTKNSIPSNVSGRAGHRRRHSFGEDELAYLPDRKREYVVEDDVSCLESDFSSEGKFDSSLVEDSFKIEKRNRRHGMLGWLKLQSYDNPSGFSSSADESHVNRTLSCTQAQPSNPKLSVTEGNVGRRKSIGKWEGDSSLALNSFTERCQAGDLFSATVRGRRPPPTGTTITDQMDLLCEQLKMLAGEIALHTSSLKRLSEQAERSPCDLQIRDQILKLKGEINEKKLQMHVLEKRMVGSFATSPHTSNSCELSQDVPKLVALFNEKTCDLEIMSADNRILQEQLQSKISEISELQDTVLMLRQQVVSLLTAGGDGLTHPDIEGIPHGASSETYLDGTTPKSNISFTCAFSNEDSNGHISNERLKVQISVQASEVEHLREEKDRLVEEKHGLEIQNLKLSEEASYAKELASAAALELRNLAEEVTKLSYQNAKLMAEFAASKEVSCGNVIPWNNQMSGRHDQNMVTYSDDNSKICDDIDLIDELKKELFSRRQREASLEASLSEKGRREADMQRRLDKANTHEQELENELGNMWMLVSHMKKCDMVSEESKTREEKILKLCTKMQNGFGSNNDHLGMNLEGRFSFDKTKGCNVAVEELKVAYESERRRCFELEGMVSKLKSENLRGLDISTLEDLQKFHVEALSKICQEKLTSRPL